MSNAMRAALTALAAAYPRYELKEATLAVYAEALADLPEQDVAAAVRALIQRSSFPPTIAEIRAEAVESRLGLPRPFRAWENVTARSKVENPDDVQLTAVERRALAAVGGTWAVRSTDNAVMLRAQFLRAYEEFRAEVIREMQAPRLLERSGREAIGPGA